MRRSNLLRAASTTALLALVCATSACAAEAEAPSGSNTSSETAPAEVIELLDEAIEGDEDRVFEASDDTVIAAVESTLESSNASAEWAGSTLRVTLDGSADSPTASMPCLGIEALLADNEDVTLVFSDGELVCADRVTAN